LSVVPITNGLNPVSYGNIEWPGNSGVFIFYLEFESDTDIHIKIQMLPEGWVCFRLVFLNVSEQ